MSRDIEAKSIEKSSVPEGAFDAFGTALPGGNQSFSRPVTPPAPDEVGGDPCPDCGAAEWWIWLDGSRLCRGGLIQGDHLGRSWPNAGAVARRLAAYGRAVIEAAEADNHQTYGEAP
jgi:hypothetical protein